MDNFDLINFKEHGEDAFPPPDPDAEKPIPFDDSEAAPQPVSRTPLSLGGDNSSKAPAPKQAAPPAARPAAKPATDPAADSAPAPTGVVSAAVTGEGRISGLKTFFTKLHPGALVFLDEQVTEWLKAHPEIQIKKTNVSVGEVLAKKTEPNLIMNIWY